MQNLNKNGLSDVVTSVLLIFVAVVAVIAISAIILKLVNNPQLSPEASCATISIKNPVEIYKVCYNQETKEVQAILKRNSEEININLIEFILNSQIESNTWACSSECPNCNILKSEQTKTYFLSSEKPETLAINVNNCPVQSIKVNNC